MNMTVTAGPVAVADTAGMLQINAVERETGISKELLRMWERRYGFPDPERNPQGERLYRPDQISKLRIIRRLLDAGLRPGKIVGLDIPALEQLVAASHSAPGPALPPDLEHELIQILQSREPGRIRDYLHHQMVKMGLQAFIMDLMQHANTLVGDAWISGRIQVFEEHLYTEELLSLVHQTMGSLRPSAQPPRIMLTTAPDELHALGILMIEALLRLDHFDVTSFGTQMPVHEIVQAVSRHRMDIVILSFSSAYPVNRAIEFLEELRFRLPLGIQIWAGGGALRNSRRQVEAVRIMQDLPDVRQAAAAWRAAKGMRAA